MSKVGTAILFAAVMAIGVTAMFLGLNAGSQPFALHMGIIALACVGFLFFIRRRAGDF